MGLCKFTTRSVVALIGLIFFVLGAALVAVAGYTLISYGHLKSDFMEQKYVMVPAALLLVAGLFFLLASMVACCTTMNHNKCLLTVLFIVIVAVMAMMGVAFALVVFKGDDLKNEVEKSISKALPKYGTKDEKPLTDSIDFVQSNLHCCGSHGPSEWKGTPYYEKNDEHYPPSCCNVKAANATCDGKSSIDPAKTGSYYTNGCFTKFYHILEKYQRYVAIGAGGAFAVLLLGLVSTLALCCIKRRSDEPQYATLTS